MRTNRELALGGEAASRRAPFGVRGGGERLPPGVHHSEFVEGERLSPGKKRERACRHVLLDVGGFAALVLTGSVLRRVCACGKWRAVGPTLSSLLTGDFSEDGAGADKKWSAVGLPDCRSWPCAHAGGFVSSLGRRQPASEEGLKDRCPAFMKPNREMKRLFVGGLGQGISEADLQNQFSRFGEVSDIEIITRKDDQGNSQKAFAYVNIKITEADLKKCMSILNKTKWKGGTLQIQLAKESFLHRLAQEREEAKAKKEKSTTGNTSLLEKIGGVDFHMKAVPGTEVPGHKNWVVSKFGRVLPVLHLKSQHKNKISFGQHFTVIIISQSNGKIALGFHCLYQ
ncbi:hypothetical protein NN561_015772 [Cricetulus griseus]